MTKLAVMQKKSVFYAVMYFEGSFVPSARLPNEAGKPGNNATSKVALQWNLSDTDTLGIGEVSSFQGENITYLYEVGTWSSVLIRDVSSCISGGKYLIHYLYEVGTWSSVLIREVSSFQGANIIHI